MIDNNLHACRSLMQAIAQENISFSSSAEKQKTLDKIKASYEQLTASPKLKQNLSCIALHPIKQGIIREREVGDLRAGAKGFTPNNRGKKHYEGHPCMCDNVKFEYKDHLTTPIERIDQLLNYYTKVNQEENHYNYSPALHSFYNKESAEHFLKYSNNIRLTNLSQDNPHKMSNKPERYMVMKFQTLGKNISGLGIRGKGSIGDNNYQK